MSDTLRAKILIKAKTSYTIIAEEGVFNSTEFAPNSTNLNIIAGNIKNSAPFHTSVAVKTTSGGDISFVFSEKTKLEEVTD
jgi:hypothetical protein